MSKLSDVLTSFGFRDKDVQKAFLENLYLAGYFKPEAIWQAINLMQFNNEGKKVELWKKGVDKSFDAMLKVINESGAAQDDPSKFNADFFLNHFMAQEIFFDAEDIENLIVFLAQNAFARVQGQERGELTKLPWSDVHRDQYLRNARLLGMIDEVKPAQEEYDETWIQGASRSRIMKRMKCAKEYQEEGCNLGHVRLLTGERELWVERSINCQVNLLKNV